MKYLIVYFDHTLKNRQVIRPTRFFQGSWGDLAKNIKLMKMLIKKL